MARPLLVLLLLVTGPACWGEHWDSGDGSVDQRLPQQQLLQEVFPTTPSPSQGESLNGTLSPEDSFALNRERAIQLVLGKVLRALGPEFEARLPLAPTNATLTPLNSSLRVETGTCPERYRRCSSQTFYPSCELPRNTDEQMWHQRFTLFFNISSEISSIRRNNVLNATLRLYKLKLPLPETKMFIVKLHAFTKTLKRNRERSRAAASTRLSSDYEGWVFLNVASLVPRLKSRANHGFKISIQNERNVPWNIPNFFVKMDCKASNESLIPLPFEVQLDDNTQRYPALNIRSGTQEAESDNDYLQGYDNFLGHDSSFSLSHNLSPPHHRRQQHQDAQDVNHHHGIGDSFNSRHIDRIQRLQQQDFDQWLNPHLYDSSNSHSVGDNDNHNSHHQVMSGSSDYDDIGHNDNDETYRSETDGNYGYPDSWRSGESYPDHTYNDANGDPQPRYKKQAPHFLPNQQQADERYYMQHDSDRHYHYDDGTYDMYDELSHGDVDVKSDFADVGDADNSSLSLNDNSTDSNFLNSLILRREQDYSEERKVQHTDHARPITVSPQVLSSAESNRSVLRSENNQNVPHHFNHPYRRPNRHHHNHHNRRHHPRHHGSHHRHHRLHPHFGHPSRREELVEDYPVPPGENEIDVVTTVAPQ